ncbi:hypothetical protein GALL_532600 [mine drainage metagenome]|uniref:Uncharacterized protein n=1 Tax=mine drainage metagenome TaxID=410659 RepID=A0A1J5PBL2_9ZZZZ
MMLADPGFVVVQLIQVLQQFHVAFQGENRVLVHRMEGGEEDAAAKVGHGCFLFAC